MTPEGARHKARSILMDHRSALHDADEDEVEAIAAALLEAAKPAWRPVDDEARLGAYMLCYCRFDDEAKGQAVLLWEDGLWVDDHGRYVAECVVTHYMPLPQPPEGP